MSELLLAIELTFLLLLVLLSLLSFPVNHPFWSSFIFFNLLQGVDTGMNLGGALFISNGHHLPTPAPAPVLLRYMRSISMTNLLLTLYHPEPFRYMYILLDCNFPLETYRQFFIGWMESESFYWFKKRE